MANVLALIETAEALGPTPLPPEIEQYQDDSDPEVRGGGWEIQTQTSADWALQRVAECQAEAGQVEAQYEAAVRRLRAKADQLVARATRGANYFSFKLQVWAEHNKATLLKGKAKSVSLLHGKVGWRKKGGNLRVDDKDALVAWLSAQPIESGLYRIKVEPEMKAIQDLCRTTGEVPPGTTCVPEYDDIYVKPEAPETGIVKGEE